MLRRAVAVGCGVALALAACSALNRGTDDVDPSSDGGDGGAAATDGPALDGGSLPVGERPCTASACPVEVVLQGLDAPVTLATSPTHLYFVEVGTNVPDAGGKAVFERVPKDLSCTQRGCFEIIDPALRAGERQGESVWDTHMAIGPADVCVTQSFGDFLVDHDLGCFDLATLSRRSIDTGYDSIVDLEVGAGEIRWMTQTAASNAQSNVRSRPFDGGPATSLTDKSVNGTSVTTVNARTFFTQTADGGANGSVAAIAPNGEVVTLSAGRSFPIELVAWNGFLYWIDAGARRIMRMPADASTGAAEVATTAEFPFALAVDASGVYWATVGPANTSGGSAVFGSIARTTHAPGGAVDILMTQLENVSALTVDEGHIWAATVGATSTSGKVLRMAKKY